jgi:hypothetical protein
MKVFNTFGDHFHLKAVGHNYDGLSIKHDGFSSTHQRSGIWAIFLILTEADAVVNINFVGCDVEGSPTLIDDCISYNTDFFMTAILLRCNKKFICT